MVKVIKRTEEAGRTGGGTRQEHLRGNHRGECDAWLTSTKNKKSKVKQTCPKVCVHWPQCLIATKLFCSGRTLVDTVFLGVCISESKLRRWTVISTKMIPLSRRTGEDDVSRSKFSHRNQLSVSVDYSR